MNYRAGMDLDRWVNAHAGEDVIVRFAVPDEVDDELWIEDEDLSGWEAIAHPYEETGRLIGIVEGKLYLDSPTNPQSMPVEDVIATICRFIANTHHAPWAMVIGGVGVGSSPRQLDPEQVVEIDIDHGGIGRQRAEARRIRVEEELRFFKNLVATQPCCLCGRMVQAGEGGYNILGPDTGMGDVGDPEYVSAEPTWRVICSRHHEDSDP